MPEALFTYQPTDNSDASYLWLGIIIAIVAFGAAIYFLRQKASGRKHTNNVLIAMLLFFAGLMGFTTAFFSAWSMKRLGEVTLYAQSLSIGSSVVEYQDIRKIHFKEERNGSFMNSNIHEKSDFFLVLECTDGKIHVIPDLSFPIGEIKTNIEELRNKSIK